MKKNCHCVLIAILISGISFSCSSNKRLTKPYKINSLIDPAYMHISGKKAGADGSTGLSVHEFFGCDIGFKHLGDIQVFGQDNSKIIHVKSEKPVQIKIIRSFNTSSNPKKKFYRRKRYQLFLKPQVGHTYKFEVDDRDQNQISITVYDEYAGTSALFTKQIPNPENPCSGELNNEKY